MSDNNKTVLIVEDDEDTRDLLQHYLHKKGWSVVEADDDEEAIERARSQQRLDLIIMDLSLPRVNGLEAIRRMAIDFFKAEDISAGRLRYLAKPFQLSDIDNTLADLFPGELQ